MTIACHSSGERCAGTLAIALAKGRQPGRVVGHSRFDLAAGAEREIRASLDSRGRRLLHKQKTLPVREVIRFAEAPRPTISGRLFIHSH